jgi:hypothetical protein
LATPGKIDADSPAEVSAGDGGKPAVHEPSPANPLPLFVRPAPVPSKGVAIMDGERELKTGLLSKDASYRLIVSGRVGVREIERLIRQLEFDKEILADNDEESAPV